MVSGRLFQNRYKSILCQEGACLKERLRYIHLNPLRAGIVKTLDELDRYRYCGHSSLMGNGQNHWQETESVLATFADHVSAARRSYREFVEKGGLPPWLTGLGFPYQLPAWLPKGGSKSSIGKNWTYQGF